MENAMKTFLSTVAIVFVLAGMAQAKTAKCLLKIDGKTFIDGHCDVRLMGGGDFQVMSRDHTYFAQVLGVPSGSPTGYWNEDKFANHAHTTVGVLIRNGACWSNAKATICAW